MMNPPLYVRPWTDDERRQFEAERRPTDAFRRRRAQMVRARARGRSPQPLAQLRGCGVQTVRHALQAFKTTGLTCMSTHATRPKRVEPTWNTVHGARLQHILPQSPRTYGTPTRRWTLALAAQVCHEQGVTARCLRDDSSRRVWPRLRTNGTRAQHWITRPDPH
jgi:transposase